MARSKKQSWISCHACIDTKSDYFQKLTTVYSVIDQTIQKEEITLLSPQTKRQEMQSEIYMLIIQIHYRDMEFEGNISYEFISIKCVIKIQKQLFCIIIISLINLDCNSNRRAIIQLTLALKLDGIPKVKIGSIRLVDYPLHFN